MRTFRRFGYNWLAHTRPVLRVAPHAELSYALSTVLSGHPSCLGQESDEEDRCRNLIGAARVAIPGDLPKTTALIVHVTIAGSGSKN